MLIPPNQVTELSAGSEPVSVADAKSHLRVEISDDDTLIGYLVTAARQYAEKYCNRSFVAHTYRADLTGFADKMILPFGPVQSVTYIKYYDTSSPSVLQTLSSSVYALNWDTVYRNHGASWESVYPRIDAVQITYVTGWKDNSSPQGTGAAIPEAVKHAMKMMTAEMYENREASLVATNYIPNPLVHRLLDQHRLYQ